MYKIYLRQDTRNTDYFTFEKTIGVSFVKKDFINKKILVWDNMVKKYVKEVVLLKLCEETTYGKYNFLVYDIAIVGKRA